MLFVLERILFCLDQIPATVSLQPVCVHHCILNCVYVLKRKNTIWLGGITYMTSQIVWYNSKRWEFQRQRKVNAQCVCVLMPEWNCVCSYVLHVLICCCVLTCEWQQLVVRFGAAAPWVFNSKYLFYMRACKCQLFTDGGSRRLLKHLNYCFSVLSIDMSLPSHSGLYPNRWCSWGQAVH